MAEKNAQRMIKELELDNLGFCRFHRAWAEEMIPEIMDKIFECRAGFIRSIELTASRITSRNAAVFWESDRTIDIVHTFLKNKTENEGIQNHDLNQWLEAFDRDKRAAAYEYWYEMHKGIHETLKEFP